jgi:sterol desaturase/sphingolipid hydroxylase (fatty acid hydroxylase superfamily)
MKVLLCVLSSCVLAEFLGYWLHRLLHSSRMRILSSSHMQHHLLLYGPKQNQRPSEHYKDATVGRVALGNIGLEWLVPSTLVLGASLGMFWLLGVRAIYQAIYVVVVLGWSFVTFNYLHDRMHIKGFWMERNRWTRSWFLTARTLHDVHHRTLNDAGIMDKNFGIGFFFFDRLFGTLALQQAPFNHTGYETAQRLYK